MSGVGIFRKAGPRFPKRVLLAALAIMVAAALSLILGHHEARPAASTSGTGTSVSYGSAGPHPGPITYAQPLPPANIVPNLQAPPQQFPQARSGYGPVDGPHCHPGDQLDPPRSGSAGHSHSDFHSGKVPEQGWETFYQKFKRYFTEDGQGGPVRYSEQKPPDESSDTRYRIVSIAADWRPDDDPAWHNHGDDDTYWFKPDPDDEDSCSFDPAFSSETAEFSVPENSAPGTEVGHVAASDIERDELTYSLAGTADQKAAFNTAFALDDSTGVVTVLSGNSLDYEGQASYSFKIEVTDGKNSAGEADNTADDSISVTINVIDVNEPPGFVVKDNSRSVAENTSAAQNIGDPFTAVDPDADATLTYSLSGSDGASFAITQDTGQLQTKAALNHEQKDTYSVTVHVTDGRDSDDETDNAADDSITVTINITDVNEPPEFASATPTLTVLENTSADQNIGGPVTAVDPDADASLTYSLTGTDAASFDMVPSSGQVRTKAPLDFETKSSYYLTVSVTDGRNAAGISDSADDDTKDVEVTVTNVEEDGTLALSSVQPQVGSALTATLQDPDGGVTSEAWTWEKSTDKSSWAAISGAEAGTYTPAAADEDNYLRVKAAYTDELGPGKSAQAVSERTVRIAPPSNTAPTFNERSPATRTVVENTPPGENIGRPVAATDPESDPLTYTLSGTDASSFSIQADTGQLLTKAPLDREVKANYAVTVTARDPSLLSAAINVNVTVTNENEPPVIALQANVNYPENATSSVATYAASDPEQQRIRWSLRGGDRGDFSISSGGVLRFRSPPNFEAPADADRNNVYLVTVQASDGVKASRFSVEVTVTNVDEPGTLVLSSQQPRVGTSLTARVQDPDGSVSGAGWTWWRSPDKRAWTRIANQRSSSYAPVAADLGNYLKAISTYTDALGPGKRAEGVSRNAVQAAGAGSGRPVGPSSTNSRPAFRGSSATRSVAENTAAGRNIGNPIAATDAENDRLTYTLNGTDASSFDIVATTGQLRTKAALDHETKSRYSVTVTATDPSSSSAAVTVTIAVTDVMEPPGKPNAPAVTAASANGHTAAAASWTAPSNRGPAITGYNVQYRKQGASGWSSSNVSRSGLRATITGLLPDTTYQARVQAVNDEGASPWSDSGSGRTAVTPAGLQLDLVVYFGAAAYTVNEGFSVSVVVSLSAAADRSLEIPVNVTNGSAETGDYRVSGLSGNRLSIAPGDSSASFSISALQDSDDDDETIDLGFGTLPYKVTAGTTGTSVVTIEDDSSPVGSAGEEWEVDDHPDWRNNPPEFTEGLDTERSVEDLAPPGSHVGQPVAATDEDGDTLTYSVGGFHGPRFDIDSSTGQLKTKKTLDSDSQSIFNLVVGVSDGKRGTDSIVVSINVLDDSGDAGGEMEGAGEQEKEATPTPRATALPSPTPAPVSDTQPVASQALVVREATQLGRVADAVRPTPTPTLAPTPQPIARILPTAKPTPPTHDREEKPEETVVFKTTESRNTQLGPPYDTTPEVTKSTQVTTEEGGQGFPWWLLLLILLAAGAVTAWFFLYYRRRRRKEGRGRGGKFPNMTVRKPDMTVRKPEVLLWRRGTA